mmetsp:Transcript_379/g.999  ORF Transcript_379/g.999 Transcript_379/m.999 type:complete len:233 (-) Transcript_379:3082-3780(-)
MRLVAARSSSCSSWIVRSDLIGFDEDGDLFSDDHAASGLPIKAANETFFGLGPEECTLPSVCFPGLEQDGASQSRSRSRSRTRSGCTGVEVRPLSPNHFDRGDTGVSSLLGPPQAGLFGDELSSSPRRNMVSPPLRDCCLALEDFRVTPGSVASLTEAVAEDDKPGAHLGAFSAALDESPGRPSIDGRNPTVFIGDSVCLGTAGERSCMKPTMHGDPVERLAEQDWASLTRI